MATARAKSERRSGRYHLLEDSVRSPSARVDESAGIIRNVKILGQRSSNGRVYSREAIRRAAHLYEGVSVRVNHPADPDDQRASEDVLGWLRDVRVGDDGDLYGDLHCLKSHPMTPRLLEAARRNPRLYGLSHNSEGQLEMVDGRSTVTDISEVRSVDLVADPASTKGLFESVQRNKRTRGRMKLREFMGRIKLLKPTRSKINALMEGENAYMDPDADVGMMEADDVEASAGAMPTSDPADVAADDPEKALQMGFSAAMHAVVDDTTLSPKDKAKRIQKLATVALELIGQGQELPEQEEPDAEPDGDEDPALMEAEDCDDPAKKPVAVKESVESLRKKNAQLLRERAARELCEANGVRPTSVLLEALAALDSDAKRLSLLEAHRPERKAKTAPGYDPSAPRRRDPDDITDTDSFVRALTSPAA